MLHFRKQGAFTLIELLIVVAIIAILAAIAVPNFLEAQTRAKVSRAKSDMRTLATALESYYVDNNNYAPSAPVRNDAGANEAFLSASTPDPLVADACKWWASIDQAWATGDGTRPPKDDTRPIKAFAIHIGGSAGDPNNDPKYREAFETSSSYDSYFPSKWGSGAWWNDGLSIPVGGSGFVALSTPISYISNPLLSDPWMNGAASYVKYVACNKFMPIGFSGGVESYVTSKTGAVHTMYNDQNPKKEGDIEPAATGAGSDNEDFDAREDSQILWWALYCVGPDKTDSVIVNDGSDDVRQDMMDMWVAKADTADPSIAEMVGAHVYDPTNGTKSGGEIWRLGGGRPSENTSNSDGTVFDDNDAYSATPIIYQNLSQMVK